MANQGFYTSVTRTDEDRDPVTNFSRPRGRRQRSYSTESMFRGPDRLSAEHKQESHTAAPVTKTAPTRTNWTTPPRGRVLRTTDDGRLEQFSKAKSADEAGVTEAFKRWQLSEKARLKHKRPDLDAEYPDPDHAAAPSYSATPAPPPRHPHHIHRRKQDKGPIYEKVDGAVLDTKPAATGPFGQEISIPEIEAVDVRDIQDNPIGDHASSLASSEDPSTGPSLSMTSTTSSSEPSRQFSSAASNSSSATSTNISTPSPQQRVSQDRSPYAGTAYKHLSAAYMPSPVRHGEIPEQSSDLEPEILQDAPESALLELDSKPSNPRAPLEPSAAPTVLRKVSLDAIREEHRNSTATIVDDDAAPAPAVKGVSDEEVMATKSQHLKLSAIRHHILHDHGNKQDTSDTHSHPPRAIVASGIGNDPHIYELDAPAALSNAGSAGSDFQQDARRNSVDKHGGVLGKLEHGVSKATHVLHEKVKKTVTFNTVDDVRLMTPSPRGSMQEQMR